MSGVAVSSRTQADRLRLALSADALAVGALGVWVAVLVVLTWGTWGDIDSATGYDLIAGHRIANGEVLYRDFAYYYGPLAPVIFGLVAVVFGSGIAPAVAIGFAATVAIVAATYVVARILIDPFGGFVAAAITAAVALIPDEYNYVLPHASDITFGVLLILAILLGIYRYVMTGGSRWLVAIGALGLVVMTKPEPAFGAVVAVGCWLVTRLRHSDSFRRECAFVAGTATLIAVSVYGFLAAIVGPHRLIFDNLYPTGFVKYAGAKELRGRMPLTLESVLTVGEKVVLYAVGVTLLLAAGSLLGRMKITRAVTVGVIAAGGFAAVAALATNPEALRHGLEFAYGWIPAVAAVALGALLWRGVRGRERFDARSQLELTLVAALAGVALTIYAGFIPHAPSAQMAVYYFPLASIFLVRLHLKELAPTRAAYVVGAAWVVFLAVASAGLTLKDARVESVVVRGPGGALRETPLEGRVYQEALRQVERATKPGDAIFAAPELYTLFSLADRWTPVEQITTLPGGISDLEEQRRAIAALQTANVRVILTQDLKYPEYGYTAFGESFDRALVSWIHKNFARSAALKIPAHVSFEGPKAQRTVTVWVRRNR